MLNYIKNVKGAVVCLNMVVYLPFVCFKPTRALTMPVHCYT